MVITAGPPDGPEAGQAGIVAGLDASVNGGEYGPVHIARRPSPRRSEAYGIRTRFFPHRAAPANLCTSRLCGEAPLFLSFRWANREEAGVPQTVSLHVPGAFFIEIFRKTQKPDLLPDLLRPLSEKNGSTRLRMSPLMPPAGKKRFSSPTCTGVSRHRKNTFSDTLRHSCPGSRHGRLACSPVLLSACPKQPCFVFSRQAQHSCGRHASGDRPVNRSALKKKPQQRSEETRNHSQEDETRPQSVVSELVPPFCLFLPVAPRRPCGCGVSCLPSAWLNSSRAEYA